MMAAPSKLTPEAIQKAEQAASLGASYKDIAGYMGVSYGRLREYLKEGERASHGLKHALCEAIARGRARGALLLLNKIREAANGGDWRAAAWVLEHSYAADYNRQVQEVTGDPARPVPVVITSLTTVAPGEGRHDGDDDATTDAGSVGSAGTPPR